MILLFIILFIEEKNMGLSDIGSEIRGTMGLDEEIVSGAKSTSESNFGFGESLLGDDKPSKIEFVGDRMHTTEETLATLKSGAEKLGEAGSKAVVALRTLFEQVKEKIKRKDLEKLESEIQKIEDEKKIELERAGLLKHKLKLEEQLKAIKSRKLEGLI